MAISIAAIVLGAIALVVATSISYSQSDKMVETSSYSPQTKDIYLFSKVDENIDEDKFGIPPDMFSLGQIVVHKGDNVSIHFYNLEPVETQEHHTFTIEGGPYKMNYDINAGESTTIEFTASEVGSYEYLCTFHKPTMSGQLVVLG
jgi:plastocyanin